MALSLNVVPGEQVLGLRRRLSSHMIVAVEMEYGMWLVLIIKPWALKETALPSASGTVQGTACLCM